MSPPWMPLYIADYIADTGHLGALESGGYLHLIMHYWRHGGIPSDDASLARIARMTAREWAKSRALILAFFDAELRHKRIDSELEKAREKSGKRSEAGSRGGKSKALKNNNAHLANATDLPEQKAAVALASSSQPSQVLKEEPAADAAGKSAMDENPKDVLFGEGLRWLRKETGKPDASLRSSLGKMLKLAGGDANAGLVLGVLRDAKRERKADPIGWAMGVLHDRSNARAGPPPPQQTTDPIYLAAAKLMGEANGERELQNTGCGDTGAGGGQFLEFGPSDYRRIG